MIIANVTLGTTVKSTRQSIGGEIVNFLTRRRHYVNGVLMTNPVAASYEYNDNGVTVVVYHTAKHRIFVACDESLCPDESIIVAMMRTIGEQRYVCIDDGMIVTTKNCDVPLIANMKTHMNHEIGNQPVRTRGNITAIVNVNGQIAAPVGTYIENIQWSIFEEYKLFSGVELVRMQNDKYNPFLCNAYSGDLTYFNFIKPSFTTYRMNRAVNVLPAIDAKKNQLPHHCFLCISKVYDFGYVPYEFSYMRTSVAKSWDEFVAGDDQEFCSVLICPHCVHLTKRSIVSLASCMLIMPTMYSFMDDWLPTKNKTTQDFISAHNMLPLNARSADTIKVGNTEHTIVSNYTFVTLPNHGEKIVSVIKDI